MTFAEVDSKVKEIEKYLNESHIKHLIIENLEISREEDHGKLIHAAFSFNPRNLWHGPSSNLRIDDPKQKHDLKILKNESPEYQAAYKRYLENSCIDNFRRLPQNRAIKATKSSSQTGAKAFYYKLRD